MDFTNGTQTGMSEIQGTRNIKKNKKRKGFPAILFPLQEASKDGNTPSGNGKEHVEAGTACTRCRTIHTLVGTWINVVQKFHGVF